MLYTNLEDCFCTNAMGVLMFPSPEADDSSISAFNI